MLNGEANMPCAPSSVSLTAGSYAAPIFFFSTDSISHGFVIRILPRRPPTTPRRALQCAAPRMRCDFLSRMVAMHCAFGYSRSRANRYEWRDGLVVGLGPGVLRMAQLLLDLALRYDVLLIFVLFNGALLRGSSACSLLQHDDVLDSLLTNAITPLGRALRGYESLAMLEVINEPEGLIDIERLHTGEGHRCTNAQRSAVCSWRRGCGRSTGGGRHRLECGMPLRAENRSAVC